MNLLLLLLFLILSIYNNTIIVVGYKNNIFTKSLFTLTEIIGKISNNNNNNNNNNNVNKLVLNKKSVEEIGNSIKNEYENIFWATGNMDMSLWANNCTFSDPFNSFGGEGSLNRFKQNADNLGKFIINPKLKINSYSIINNKDEIDIIKVGWIYSSFLKLPWTPILAASGETFHYLDKNTNLIIKYQETWKSDPIEVLLRLLKPAKVNSNN